MIALDVISPGGRHPGMECQAYQKLAFNAVFQCPAGAAWDAFWKWHATKAPSDIEPARVAIVIERAVAAGVISIHPLFAQVPVRQVCRYAAKKYCSQVQIIDLSSPAS